MTENGSSATRPDRGKAAEASPPGAPQNPRAFAIGSGVVLQTVGTLFALASCCLWSTSSFYMERAAAPAARWSDFLFANPIAAAWTVGILTTFVGGIGLVAAGIGLQGERPGSGTLAMLVSGLMTLVLVALCLLLLIVERAYLAALTPLVLALVCGLLFALSAHSAGILRRFPPPPDLSRATPEILEEHRRRREERIREME